MKADKAYRTRKPLKVIGVAKDWQGHAEGDIRRMLDCLRELKRGGLAIIED